SPRLTAVLGLVCRLSTFLFTLFFFFFSSRRRHTRSKRDWSSDVCSSDLRPVETGYEDHARRHAHRRADAPMRLHRWLRIYIGVPLLDAISQPHRRQSAAPHPEVTLLLIRRRAKSNFTPADIGLPYQFAFLIRIERPDHAGFLSGHNQALTIRQVH